MIVEQADLIETHGEIHRSLTPGKVDTSLNVAVTPVDDHPNIATIAMTLDIKATDLDSESDSFVDWASIRARYGIQARELSFNEQNEDYMEVTKEMWPYLRGHCLSVAGQLGIRIGIPLDPGVLNEAVEAAAH